MDETVKIVFLSANPVDAEALRLDNELRVIQEEKSRLDSGKYFRLEHIPAARFEDLHELLLHDQPDIVHYSGHGTGEEGLVFVGDGGVSETVNNRALVSLFQLSGYTKHRIKCVLLNACYSHWQAVLISEYVDCVIGVDEDLDDSTAIAFTRGFYRAIFRGADIALAFRSGISLAQAKTHENEPDRIRPFDKDDMASRLRFAPISEPDSKNHLAAPNEVVDISASAIEYSIQEHKARLSMPFLPEFAVFGPLEMLELYESDLSLPVVLCRNKAMQYFLAVKSQASTSNEMWHLAAISRPRLQHVTSGAIDLRTVFVNPENRELIRVSIGLRENAIPSDLEISLVDPRNVEPTLLPKADEHIEQQTETLPIITETISQKANQTNRDYIRFRLEFAQALRSEAPARYLADLLKSIQETLDVIALSLDGTGSHYGAVPTQIRAHTELHVTNIGAGSFEIELASTTSALQSEVKSTAGEAIAKLFSLMRAGDDESALLSAIRGLQERSVKKYHEFISLLAKTVIANTTIESASPGSTLSECVKLPRASAQKISTTIEQVDQLHTRYFGVIGRLDGANRRLGTYELSSVDNETERYTGSVLPEAENALSNAQLGEVYTALLRHTVYLKRSPRYDLAGLWQDEE